MDVYSICVLIYFLNSTLSKQISKEKAMSEDLADKYKSTMSEIWMLLPKLEKILSILMKSRFTLDLLYAVLL